MRTLLILSLALFLAGCGDKGQSAISAADQLRVRETIRAQSEDMQKKIMGADVDGFIAYMNPEIIAMAGGKEKLRANLAPSLPELAKTIESISLGEISEIVNDGGRWLAFVPLETVYRLPAGRFRQKTYRIACSTDGGKAWTFMDGQGKKEQEAFFRTKFPVLTKNVPFPKCGSEKL
jgi:hypothetical protein